MDESSLASIVALLALLAINAWMEFSYAVLTNYRRKPLAERSEAGDKQARRTLQLSEDLPRLYITTQLVLMLARFAIVAVAVINIADPVVLTHYADAPNTTRVLIYTVILLPLALLTYVFGDLVPSSYGQLYADQALNAVASVARVLLVIFSPLVFLMMQISKLLTRISGSEQIEKAVTEEEIMTLVDVGEKTGAIEDEEKEMIYSVLQFGETLAREVMVPRPDIIGIELNGTLQEGLREIVDTGHSRIPVYDDSIDDIKGVLYAKDILTAWQHGQFNQTTIRSLMRPAYFVPETKRADMLFREMQAAKSHIAIVVDEYGGTAGLVTIEDLLEEIVGDIKDEYDVNEEAEYLKLGEQEYMVDGGMNIEDLNELMEIDLPSEDNDSIGGYVYSALGRVPEVGEELEVPEHRVRIIVEAVDNRRIRKLHMIVTQDVEETPADDDEVEAREGGKNGLRSTREAQSVEPKSNPSTSSGR
ncbi:MAG: CBS domain-containing protein [Chloroflexi bacterium OLB15]|nr:MAG: CBS domain-containing protein [Chloroflexi bacterium OLB15]